MLHRATVLEDIIHILPPAVAQRVNSVVSESEQAAASEATKDGAQSSSAPASAPVAAPASAPVAAPVAEDPDDPQRGYSRELESWVTLAHLLATEVSSLDKQLQDWKTRPEKTTTLLRRVNEKLKTSAQRSIGSSEPSESDSKATISDSKTTTSDGKAATSEGRATMSDGRATASDGSPALPSGSLGPAALAGTVVVSGMDRGARRQRASLEAGALEISQIRLLIVEDDQFQRDALRKQSSRVGFAAVRGPRRGP